MQITVTFVLGFTDTLMLLYRFLPEILNISPNAGPCVYSFFTVVTENEHITLLCKSVVCHKVLQLSGQHL